MPSRKLNACVVGSGPSGFYITKYLNKSFSGLKVTIIDALPTPFGLVRYGVAPDHPNTKNVINDFTKILSLNNVFYLGNVKVGNDVTLSEIKRLFDVVILTYGASKSRMLNIPGESSKNVHTSHEFVGWYNGYPGYRNKKFNFDGENVIIIGNGNVALDCARILLTPIKKLNKTDIMTYSLNALRESKYKKIFIIGRKGPLEAKFGNKELREIIKYKTINTTLDSAYLNNLILSDNINRRDKRKIDLYKLIPKDIDSSKKHNLIFKFYYEPYKVISNERDEVTAVIFKEQLSNSNKYKTINTGLVIKSLGYKATTIDESIPFDKTTNTVINHQGRINYGLYVSGWLKRGAKGLIGSNLVDAKETVEIIMSDIKSDKIRLLCENSYKKFTDLLEKKKIKFITTNGWKRIDLEEKARGKLLSKERDKITDIHEMIRIANVGK